VTAVDPPEASPARRALAWSVHLFTASGAVVGTVALLEVARGDFSRAALLMLVALAIDSVDGTLARAVGVRSVLPRFDGRRLDDMVDYFNYVLVPAVFMLAAGNLPHWAWATLPILSSAYGFSQAAAKTDDGFFLGFPSYWNVMALYLWLFDVGPAASVAIVAGFTILVFVPLKYVYASQLRVLGRTTNLLAAVWIVLMAYVVLDPGRARALRLAELSLLFPIYYHGISIWLGGLYRGPERPSP
jgi:phosphatidylcholine synthase